MECRCAQDGGDYCYNVALEEAKASGDDAKVALVERLNASRRASEVPFHVIDPLVLSKIAVLLKPLGDS